MIRERKFDAVPGLPMLLLFLAALVLFVLGIRQGGQRGVGAVGPRLGAGAAAHGLSLCRLVRRESERGKGPAAVRRLRRDGAHSRAALGESLLHEEADFAARAQLRERAPQGQRQRRQPDRNRRRRRLAGRRHGGGRLPGGRLQQLREGAERIGAAEPRHELHLRHPRRFADVAAQPHGGGGGSPQEGDSGPAVDAPASK